MPCHRASIGARIFIILYTLYNVALTNQNCFIPKCVYKPNQTKPIQIKSNQVISNQVISYRIRSYHIISAPLSLSFSSKIQRQSYTLRFRIQDIQESIFLLSPLSALCGFVLTDTRFSCLLGRTLLCYAFLW